MRVTANMSADISIYNIQQQQSRIDKIVEKLNSNQTINRPSDDPVASGTLLDISDKSKAYDQYGNNSVKAKSWLEFTNNGLTGVSGILDSVRGMLSGSTALNIQDATDRQMAHDQLVELKKQLVEMANMKYGDQYIFGGGNNLVPPFSQKAGTLTSGSPNVTGIDVTGLTPGMPATGTGIPPGSFIDVITADTTPNTATGSFTLRDGSGISVSATVPTTTPPPLSPFNSNLVFYAGDGTQREVEITTSTRQTISTTGDRLLLGGGSDPNYGNTNILQTMDDLIAAVGDGDPGHVSNPAAVTAAGLKLEAGAKQVFSAITTNISRIHRVDNMVKLNELNQSTLTSIADSIQNVDLVKFGMQLNIEKNAFEASLAATAKVSQMSLLNYL
jgi:flagellin-like hook-associated protein FlgL